MAALIRTGKRNPLVRQTAVSLVEGLPQKDRVGEVRRLHAYVRDNIRYLRDINGVETLHTPERILQQGQGDCDDKSILLASLLESIGQPTRLLAIGFIPGKFSHVLIETRLGDSWVPLETTEPVDIGWFPKGVRAKMVVYV